MNELIGQLQDRIETVVEECCELGYNPTRFRQMVKELGVVSAMSKLVTSLPDELADIQLGYRRMRELGRMDLTVESIMLEERWANLFPVQIRDAARWRLNTF